MLVFWPINMEVVGCCSALNSALNTYCLFLSECDWKLESFTNHIKPLSHLRNRTYNFSCFSGNMGLLLKEKDHFVSQDLSLEDLAGGPSRVLLLLATEG